MGKGGVGLPYKGDGVIVIILKRTPKTFQNPLLWAWSEQFSTPKR